MRLTIRDLGSHSHEIPNEDIAPTNRRQLRGFHAQHNQRGCLSDSLLVQAPDRVEFALRVVFVRMPVNKKAPDFFRTIEVTDQSIAVELVV